MKLLNSSILIQMIQMGARNLSNNKDMINKLNVFPVPDGDTGTNMNLSMQSAVQSIQQLEESPSMELVVKVFSKGHGKANVFNEALCHTRVEESGLDIPKVLEVSTFEDQWAIAIEYVEGKTLAQLMEENPDKVEQYINQFVDLQIKMSSCKVNRLTFQKDKFSRKINSLKDTIDATARYELCTRLNSMPAHTKLCHGDFNPTNVIVKEDGSMAIVDWSHATQGNASGDAAITYQEFALKNPDLADYYLDVFCKKTDTD